MTNPFALDTAPVVSTATGQPVVHQQPVPANPFAGVAQPAPVAPVAAQPVPVVTAPGDDPFSGPAPQQPRGPRLRDLYGRLLLVVPVKLEKDVPNRREPGKTQDRMTADVIVLDGGPIAYGGTPEKTPSVPHDKTAQVPHKTAAQYISAAGIISQCREALAKRMLGQPGMVLGRLTVGQAKEPGHNAPWLLSVPTDADKALARQYLAQVDPFA